VHWLSLSGKFGNGPEGDPCAPHIADLTERFINASVLVTLPVADKKKRKKKGKSGASSAKKKSGKKKCKKNQRKKKR
jgi:hypothetical protein